MWMAILLIFFLGAVSLTNAGASDIGHASLSHQTVDDSFMRRKGKRKVPYMNNWGMEN